MAFTVTLLSWSAVEFSSQLYAKGELQNALAAIRWGTDYLLKAHPQPDVLYAEVGDGNSDHACWQRPEDMTTPRDSYWLGDSKPGSDVAGETAAALAAASIVNTLSTQLKEKYNDKMLKMQRYDDEAYAVYDELFTYACPKFITPSVPSLEEPLANYNQDAYRLQLKLFLYEVKQQQLLASARSFLLFVDTRCNTLDRFAEA